MEGNNRKPNLGKPVPIIILLLLGFIMIYLVSDSGSAEGILSQYGTLTNGGHAGITPQLQFLRIYTMTTGDTTLALRAGLSLDEIEQLVDEGHIGDDGDNGGTSGKETFASGKTVEEWKKALKERADNEGNVGEYFQVGAGYKIVEFNGSAYLIEVQSNGKWPVYNGTENGEIVTVDSVGCYMFACSTAINTLNNSTVSIADIMKEMRPDKSNYSYDSNAHTWTGSMTKVGQGVDSECKGVFTSRGLSYGTISDKSLTGAQAKDVMLKEGFDNTVYIIYGHKSGVISSGSKHWVVCIGADDSNLYVLNNGSRGVEVSLDKLSNSGDVTTIIKVSK